MNKSGVLTIIILFLTANIYAGYDVNEKINIQWNSHNGIKIQKSFSSFYGAQYFQMISADEAAILSIKENKIKIFDTNSNIITNEINVPDNSEIFTYSNSKFAVLSNNIIYEYENNGSLTNQYIINRQIKFTDKLKYVGNSLFALTAGGNSIQITENDYPLPIHSQIKKIKGWVFKNHLKANTLRLNENTGVIRFYMNNTNTKEKNIYFEKSLASLVLIDIINNTAYLNAEFIISHSPIKIEREIIKFNFEKNEILERVKIPNIYYSYSKNDVSVIGEDIYYMLTSKENCTILQLELNENKSNTLFPSKYDYNYHFNNELEKIDFTDNSTLKDTPPITRSEVLQLAEEYVLLNWTASSSNISGGVVQTPDGQYIRTPDWVTAGSKIKVPYKWGGFTDISTFVSGVNSGAYAGDNYTSSVSWSDNYCVGVDCSGFVSRAWGQPQKYGTSTLQNISTAHSSLYDLERGDIVNYASSHVRLCIEDNPSGTVSTAEASGSDWRVSYRTFNFTSLTNYEPRYYNNIQNDDNGNETGLFVVEVKSGVTELNVRQGPGTGYSIITEIDQGEKFLAFEHTDGWYKFYIPSGTGSSYGWCCGGTTSENGYLKASNAAPYAEVTCDALNVRTGPGTENSVITTISNGQKFVILGTSGNWYELQLCNADGYTSGWSYQPGYLEYNQFAIDGTYGAEFISADVPASMDANSTAEFSITLKNIGKTSWDINTILTTSNPQHHESVFHHTSWISTSKICSAGDILPGQEHTISFTGQAPDVTANTSETEFLNLMQDGICWFSGPEHLGPQDDEITFSLTVNPDMSLYFTSAPVNSINENSQYYYDAQCNLEESKKLEEDKNLYNFKGKILDKVWDKPIENAEIWIKGKGIAGYTNANGEFSVYAPFKTTDYLRIQKKGYMGMKRMLYTDSFKKEYHTIQMIPQNPDYNEIQILEEKRKKSLSERRYNHGNPLPYDEMPKITEVPAARNILMTDGSVVTMSMDEYLKGVVPSEVGAYWHEEALKAQALAARCYAATTNKHSSVGAHLCTTTHCQAWNPDHYDATDNAVDETHNCSILYDGNIISALFFGHCIGHTKNAEDVWGNYYAYLRSVDDLCTYDSYFGHGVGLCQEGTRDFADQGWSWQEIVTHYYSNTTVYDPNDNITFAYTLQNAPDWLSINSETGEIFGTPNNSDIGTHSISIKLTDSNDNTVYQNFDLTVNNIPPEITSVPVTAANAGESYYYNTQSDQEGIGGTFYLLVTAPEWLSINSSTGEITGTAEGGNYTIKIKCDDTHSGIDYQEYTLNVSSPEISISPASITLPNAPVDNYSGSEQFTITNNGTYNLDISGISVSSSIFEIEKNSKILKKKSIQKEKWGNSISGFTLTPSSSQIINVRFKPLNAVVYNGTITVNSNDPDNPVLNIPVSGTGIFLNAPSNLVCTAGDSEVLLQWEAPVNKTLTGYNIYRNSSLLTSTVSVQFTDYDVVNGNSYSYYVTALYSNPDYESEPTETETAVPGAEVSEQTISLSAGWNLVSFAAETGDMSPNSFFADISGVLEEVKTSSATYNPDLPEFMNTLHEIEMGKGYWVRTSSPVNFNISGNPPDLGTLQINLSSGWNLIGYPYLYPQNIPDVLSSVTDKMIQLKSLTGTYDPDLPEFMNTLSQMSSGEGYWLDMSENAVLNFSISKQDFLYPFSKVGLRSSDEKHPFPNPVVLTNSMTLYALIDMPNYSGTSEDVIAAFAGSECRAVQNIIQHQGNTYATLVISTENSGETISFKIWDADTDIVLSVDETVESIPGGTVGDPNNGGFFEMTGFTDIENEIPESFSAKIYPNPFNPETVIEFILPQMQKVRINIYNSSGQHIMNLLEGRMSAGRHKICWNASNEVSGVYFCEIRTDSEKINRKIVLLK